MQNALWYNIIRIFCHNPFYRHNGECWTAKWVFTIIMNIVSEIILYSYMKYRATWAANNGETETGVDYLQLFCEWRSFRVEYGHLILYWQSVLLHVPRQHIFRISNVKSVIACRVKPICSMMGSQFPPLELDWIKTLERDFIPSNTSFGLITQYKVISIINFWYRKKAFPQSKLYLFKKAKK